MHICEELLHILLFYIFINYNNAVKNACILMITLRETLLLTKL